MKEMEKEREQLLNKNKMLIGERARICQTLDTKVSILGFEFTGQVVNAFVGCYFTYFINYVFIIIIITILLIIIIIFNFLFLFFF